MAAQDEPAGQAAAAPAASGAGLDRRLLWFNLLLVVLVVSLVAASQLASRRNFLERAQVATDNLAGALAQSLDAEIDQVDVGLRNVVFAVEHQLADSAALDPRRVEATLDQQMTLLPQLESIRIADAQGMVRHGRGVAAAPPTSVADRGYFQSARDGRVDGPVVAGPMQARISQRWVVVVARPLHDPQGRFVGVVYANVAVEHFASLLEGVDLGKLGAITVRGSDLGLIARRSARPGPPPETGSRVVSAELSQTLASQPEAGRFIARTVVDGVERANAYRRVGAAPLVVIVGLATDDFLAPWRVQARDMTVLAVLVLCAIAASSLLLYRAWAGETRSVHALVQQGERHRALLRAASDGMHVIDRSGRLVEMSDSFAAMLGYTREQLLGQHVSFWDVRLTREQVQRRLAGFQMGALVHFGSRHRCSDGRILEVEVLSLGVRIEGEELLYCSSRDVTERRAQARELEQHRHHLEALVAERTEQWRLSELRYRALVEQTLVGVYVQVGNEYRFVNPAFAAIFGYDSPEQMTGGAVRAHTLIAAEDLDRVNEVSRRVISGEEPVTQLDFTGLRRDGGRIALETFACPIHDADGPAAIGLLLDVTAQRRAEAERAAALVREQGLRGAAERQAQSLRELLEQREEFVRVLAHEVRQPLNNASAALQSATAGLLPQDGAAQRIARAQSVIGQIVASLDNTLAATALLASSHKLDTRDADVGTLIDLSLGDLDAKTRSRVRVERVSSTRTASMDIGLMRLALRNVLGNALAYSPAGSEVVLRIVDSDEPLALVFEVVDQGPGIADDLVPRLFERGERGSHGLPGHGIGLHVVKRVMELHGGQVDVQPHRPRGAVFRLWLPQGQ
ncbi:MAG: PAS domain S-box protein [Piscinibacter sp.]